MLNFRISIQQTINCKSVWSPFGGGKHFSDVHRMKNPKERHWYPFHRILTMKTVQSNLKSFCSSQALLDLISRIAQMFWNLNFLIKILLISWIETFDANICVNFGCVNSLNCQFLAALIFCNTVGILFSFYLRFYVHFS